MFSCGADPFGKDFNVKALGHLAAQNVGMFRFIPFSALFFRSTDVSQSSPRVLLSRMKAEVGQPVPLFENVVPWRFFNTPERTVCSVLATTPRHPLGSWTFVSIWTHLVLSFAGAECFRVQQTCSHWQRNSRVGQYGDSILLRVKGRSFHSYFVCTMSPLSVTENN